LHYCNLRLQSARHLWRLCHELKLVRENQYVHCASMINDLGNQVGAWRKALGVTANSSPS
jgi:hypothetical protein